MVTMAKKVGKYQSPFDDEGNQLHYPEFKWVQDPDFKPPEGQIWWPRGRSVVQGMRDNFEFDDVLVYQDFRRGRSAAYFEFKRKSTDTDVTVFLKELHDMIPFMVRGEVTGRFTFIKRGENYGCTILTQESK